MGPTPTPSGVGSIVATDVEANTSDQGQLLPLLDEVSEDSAAGEVVLRLE